MEFRTSVQVLLAQVLQWLDLAENTDKLVESSPTDLHESQLELGYAIKPHHGSIDKSVLEVADHFFAGG